MHDPKSDDTEVLNESIVIFEAIVTPKESEPKTMDVVRQAKFHLREMQDEPDVDDVYQVTMNPMLNGMGETDDKDESCLNILNPIKVFKIRDRKLIHTLEEHMGREDDDDFKIFPDLEDIDHLIVICAFNDGTKSPNDVPNE